MFKSVLVPLDGSSLAEQALATAARVAHASQGKLLLVRVNTAPSTFGSYATEESHFTHDVLANERSHATEYLTQIIHSPLLSRLDVQIIICSGSPADIIVEVAQSHACDLIVMSNHGASGVKRLLMGSVAQKVVRQSTIPVLVLTGKIQPSLNQAMNAGYTLHLLVGLDGSSCAEAIITPAIQLCASLTTPEKSILHLLHVVQPTPYVRDEGKAIADRMTATNVHAAKQYLANVERRIHDGGFGSCTSVVTAAVITSNKLTVNALVNAARTEAVLEQMKDSEPYPIIALATHGRRGILHWALGSVTEHMLGSTIYPLLAVHMPTSHVSHHHMNR